MVYLYACNEMVRDAHPMTEMHTGGNTNSPYTSWTTDPSVARSFATNGESGKGVLLTKGISKGEITVSKNSIYFNESEKLVKGNIKGAKVDEVSK